MKVIIVYPFETGQNAFSGGIPKVVVNNILACTNLGYETYLVLPLNNLGLVNYLRSEKINVTIKSINFKPPSLFSDTKGIARVYSIMDNLKYFLLGMNRLKKCFKSIAPDIIHYHEIVNFPFLHLYNGPKKILHLHSFRFTSYKMILPLIFRAINKHVNILLSPTNSILKAIEQRHKINSTQIDTPYLDLADESSIEAKFKPNKSEKIIFAFVGRICRIKRIHLFIEALGKLNPETITKLEFWIIGGTNNQGDEKYKSELENQIVNFQLQKYVFFKGYINPIEDALSSINFGVILSESEAVPMIGIEFMKFNIPIIGFDAPGINDFLINEENGFLISNGSVDSLKLIIEKIMNDNIQKNTFEKSIPNLFQRHSLASFQKNLKELYEQTS